MEKTTAKKKSLLLRFLDKIEAAGNKLPHPMTIFFYLSVLVVVVSGIGSLMGWSATGEMYNSSTGVVEEGMIFSCEPGIYLPGEFGVRLEDLMLITRDGAMSLNKDSKEMEIIS